MSPLLSSATEHFHRRAVSFTLANCVQNAVVWRTPYILDGEVVVDLYVPSWGNPRLVGTPLIGLRDTLQERVLTETDCKLLLSFEASLR